MNDVFQAQMHPQSWGDLHPEPIPEAGTPVPLPEGTITADTADAWRHMRCPRYDACGWVAIRAGWESWGCHGCAHLGDVSVRPAPGAKRKIAKPCRGPCVDCGQRVTRYKARRCRACSLAHTKAQAAARRVTITCARCGATKAIPAHRQGRSKFCSRDCQLAARRENGRRGVEIREAKKRARRGEG